MKKVICTILTMVITVSLAACTKNGNNTEVILSGTYVPKDDAAVGFTFGNENTVQYFLFSGDKVSTNVDEVSGTYIVKNGKMTFGKYSLDFHKYEKSIFLNGVEFIKGTVPLSQPSVLHNEDNVSDTDGNSSDRENRPQSDNLEQSGTTLLYTNDAGFEVVFELDGLPTFSELEKTSLILRQRLDEIGVTKNNILLSGNHSIILEIYDTSDVETIMKHLSVSNELPYNLLIVSLNRFDERLFDTTQSFTAGLAINCEVGQDTSTDLKEIFDLIKSVTGTNPARVCKYKGAQIGILIDSISPEQRETLLDAIMQKLGIGYEMLSFGDVMCKYGATGELSSNTWEFGAVIENNVQIINSALLLNRYPAVTVQAGIPVKWIINASEENISSCNSTIFIPEYGIEHKFIPGENIIEFSPMKSGVFPYSCWIGLIRGNITVK